MIKKLTGQSFLLPLSFFFIFSVSELIKKGDECYLERENQNKAKEAKRYYEEAIRLDSNNYEGYWRLAKVIYFLVDGLPKKERIKLLKEGIEIARKAVKLQPNRAEGHFWLASLLGVYVKEKGIKSFSFIEEIKKEFNLALKYDSTIEDGGAYTALGRLYYQLPSFAGGSLKKSLEYLLRAKRISPNNPYTKLYLADTYLSLKRKEEAKRELEELIKMEEEKRWLPEIKKLKEIAKKKIKEIK
ncbi:MAG: tetratricopeptide repeat protein [candidate division WOR-3 bacterium]|nr:tetratricopeptide repeat protein [candidate division WOR-3 bacterium]MDW8113924.1 tetratricopeptide repeat protein [candidate division WOR-3 bacterium]